MHVHRHVTTFPVVLKRPYLKGCRDTSLQTWLYVEMQFGGVSSITRALPHCLSLLTASRSSASTVGDRCITEDLWSGLSGK